MENDTGSLINRIAVLEKKIEDGDFVTKTTAIPLAEAAEPKPKKIFDRPVPADIQYVVDNWGTVKRHISNPYKTFLNDARFSVKGEDTLLIVFNAGSIGYEGCNKPEVIEMLNNIISEEINKQVKVEMTMLESNQNFGDYFQEVVLKKINMEVVQEDF
jgi:DNA polymerase-3 subunit gamma/tau